MAALALKYGTTLSSLANTSVSSKEIAEFINTKRFIDNMKTQNSFTAYTVCAELDNGKYEMGDLTPFQYIMKYVYKLQFLPVLHENRGRGVL